MNAKTKSQEKAAKSPLILRSHRLMEAFAKSDDERDFYLDRTEGFLLFIDLDKSLEELQAVETELQNHPDRYCPIPKMTFYETKKMMENFVNEKVYDIDVKEKLLDIIQAKEARENFLEFLYDQHAELDKWQQYYQERARIRIIEWLRKNKFQFVFEEDLDLPKNIIEKLKENLFDSNVSKEIENARKTLVTKAKNYYSSEALNPRPKRGRPPKQIQKQEIETPVTSDIFLSVPQCAMPFLFTPEIGSIAEITFSSKFSKEEHLASREKNKDQTVGISIDNLNRKLASLRQLSSSLQPQEPPAPAKKPEKIQEQPLNPSPKKAAPKLTSGHKKPAAAHVRPLRKITPTPTESKQRKPVAPKPGKKIHLRRKKPKK